jgi:hypothetical protein
VLRDEMNDLPFPLDAALHGEHGGIFTASDSKSWVRCRMLFAAAGNLPLAGAGATR